jgi:hypothetical protein
VSYWLISRFMSARRSQTMLDDGSTKMLQAAAQSLNLNNEVLTVACVLRNTHLRHALCWVELGFVEEGPLASVILLAHPFCRVQAACVTAPPGHVATPEFQHVCSSRGDQGLQHGLCFISFGSEAAKPALMSSSCVNADMRDSAYASSP